ncbi:MAG: hypothetical protein SF053_07025 [Bacteroidia bacterium]|nr:hypothetical protein [Bacteroidia bacterium]
MYRLICVYLILAGAMAWKPVVLTAHNETRSLIEQRTEIETSLSLLHLADAERQITAMSSKPWQAYYRAHLPIYKYFATQDPAYAQTLRTNWDATIASVSALPATDPLRNVLLAELNCKRSFIEFLDENYLAATRYGRAGRSLIMQNQQKFPDNIDQKKTLGLMNVLLGSIPAKYQWVTGSLGFTGDLDAGVQQLQEFAAKGSLLRMEAQVILFVVEKNMLNRTDLAIKRIETERKRYTSPNIMLDFLQASAHLSIKQNDAGLGVLARKSQYINAGKAFFIPYWDYLLGKGHYYKDDLPNAQMYLAQFLRGYKGKLFRADANFRLGMALTMSGAYTVGKTFFKSVISSAGGFDEDEYAKHMANKFLTIPPSTQAISLFKARNLFDGGYFEKAITVLRDLEAAGLSKLSVDDRAELYYRYGRIYHSQGKLAIASSYYRRCVNEPSSSESQWLQAYSYSYMGDIARQSGNSPTAKVNYEKALSYNGYFYQSGLQNRCKVALSELKKI